MMELRIRACHVRGSFQGAGQPRRPRSPRRHKLDGPPKEFIYDRLAHPPATFRQEKLKSDVRLPAARRYIVEKNLNEIFDGDQKQVGIIVQGGLYNGLMRALRPGPRRPVRRQPRPDPRAERRLSAGARRKSSEFCAGQERGAGPRGRPARVHRAGDRHAPAPRRRAGEAARQGPACTWPASTTSNRWCAAWRSSSPQHAPQLDLASGASLAGFGSKDQGKGGRAARRAAGAAADVLRRLPGAAGVLGDEAGGAGHRPAARLDGRRLPLRSRSSSRSRRAIRCSATA